MKNIKVVIGANFGDEGKGLMTDYFASKTTNKALVVLSNGGAQRGHTVVTPEGYRHVFHHFGSGSLVGADTWMCKEFIVNPVLFMKEYKDLISNKPIFSKCKFYIDPRCKITTIFDMLINQVIEFDRKRDKHGSCGVGVFETIYRNQHGVDFINSITINPAAMSIKEFFHMDYLEKYYFLDYLRKVYTPNRLNELKIHNIDKTYLDVLASGNIIINNYINDFDEMMKHVTIIDEEILDKYDDIIFENGQGLLLDQHNMDYFPHLSPSNTGLKNPVTVLNDFGYEGIVEACYVTRTYLTRHGAGRLDNECSKDNINSNMVDMTNVPNPFQDSLRYGYLERSSLDKRIQKDISSCLNNSKILINNTIAVTHMNEYRNSIIIMAKYESTGLTRNEVLDIYKNL